MRELTWYEEIRDMRIEFDEDGLPILVDYDDDMNEIELRKLTPLEYAASQIIYKEWDMFNGKLRTNRLLHSLVGTGGNGINVISDITEDEENDCVYYMGCIYDLSDESFNEVHEEIIQMALDETAPPEPRMALINEINACLKHAKKLATPYIKLILDGLYGEIEESKYRKIPINQWLYPILRETVDEVHDVFDMQIGRNQLNEKKECAIEIVVNATNKLALHKSFEPDKFVKIRYETLRREYYKNGLIQVLESEFGFSEKQAQDFLKKQSS